MATKPTPGGSDGTYGTEMNAFLDVSLADDGKIKDGAVFSTSAAPTADASVSNKKYVDDNTDFGFSAYTTQDSESNTLLKAHAYKAQTDGMVIVFDTLLSGEDFKGFVGATNDPAGAGTQVMISGDGASATYTGTFFVQKDAFFEVTTDQSGNPSIRWMSIGTLSKPIDQD